MDPGRIREAVVASLAEIAKVPAASILDVHHLVDDLGVDSLRIANLLMSVEDRLGRSLPEGCEGKLVGVTAVGDLVSRIADAFCHGCPSE